MGWSGGLARSELSDDTMRALIDEQFPWLADRELGRRYTLEDHLAIRIGDDYGAIFPRFAYFDEFYARAADVIRPHAGAWTFHSSHPVATGVPGHGYPYHWVIVEWITASTAGFVPLRRESARPFGDAIRQIHTPSPADAPLNPLTGPGLEAKRAEFESALNTVIATGGPESLIINPQATRDVYEAGVEVDFQVPHTWTHGRFEPRAVLSDQGAFRGVLLWHNFGAGDPAADLGFAANLLPLDMRDEFWAGYGDVDPAMAARAHAYQVYAALRYTLNDDPFLFRMAWERFLELGLTHQLQ